MKDFEIKIKFSDIFIAALTTSLILNILLIRELNYIMESLKIVN